jgi:hypothetical protein
VQSDRSSSAEFSDGYFSTSIAPVHPDFMLIPTMGVSIPSKSANSWMQLYDVQPDFGFIPVKLSHA